MTDTATDWTAQALAARWTAVPNDEIGGWAVTTDGRTPLAGGRMAADMVMTRELAEHIAALHNATLNESAVARKQQWAVCRTSITEGTRTGLPYTTRSEADQARNRWLARADPRIQPSATMMRRQVEWLEDGSVVIGPWTPAEEKP